MLPYSVFHTDDDLSAQAPTFLLCTQESELEVAATFPGVPDYGLLQNNAGQWRTNFYHRGRQFQFCGAGALAIAHYLLNKNLHADATHTYTISSDDFQFEILNYHQNAAVKLTLDEPVQRVGDMLCFSECSLFTAAKVFAAPMSLKALKNFKADSMFRSFIVERELSALLYCEELTKACIYFRYFTSFNNKFEDQVTGSVFRYLPYLIGRDCGEYTVVQLSNTGATMHACFDNQIDSQTNNQSVVYWGRVQRCKG